MCIRDRKKPTYRTKTTTYVYGTHPNSKCTKEFVWRIPESLSDFAENIKVGDTIYCKTKFGVSPVVVNRIEVSEDVYKRQVLKTIRIENTLCQITYWTNRFGNFKFHFIMKDLIKS